MQLLLPIFPADTKLINHSLGVYHRDGIVTYLHSGAPIFSHSSEDLQSFRYITSNLIIQGLCQRKDIANTFHVSTDSVYSNVKKLQTQGEESFFGTEHRHGYSHKLRGDKLKQAQQCLDKEMSQNATAKHVGVWEGAIRYAIKTGKLKKSHH
jgi:transposase